MSEGEQSMGDSYLVIARRYRPQRFADVMGQEPIIRTLLNAVQSGRVCHAYLFSGSRGTGKTSIARLYAKALNCSARLPSGEPCNECPSCVEITESRSLDVLEIDGASHRGIDHIRSLTESASYAPSGGRYKIYLIDEVHMLTKEAFNALLKILEEPPQTVKFFLATTEPHKIPPTIISRCQRLNLRRLSTETIVAKLKQIVCDMNVRADDEALFRLASYADGGFRDAESLLDQVITFSDGHIRENVIEDVLGIVPTEWLLDLDNAIATADITVAYTVSDRVFYDGKDIGHFIDDLSDHYRTLLLLKLNAPPHRLAIAPDKESKFRAVAESLSSEHLLDVLGVLAEAQRTLKSAASQRFLLEWLLLSIVRVQRRVPLPLIARKLLELQEHVHEAPASCPPTYASTTTSISPDIALSRSPRTSDIQKPVKANIPRRTPPPSVSATQESIPEKEIQELAVTKTPIARTAPVPSLSDEEESARYENLVQFTGIELGGTIVKT
jgi:DNA polymerase-3 subunit gamma/tau